MFQKFIYSNIITNLYNFENFKERWQNGYCANLEGWFPFGIVGSIPTLSVLFFYKLPPHSHTHICIYWHTQKSTNPLLRNFLWAITDSAWFSKNCIFRIFVFWIIRTKFWMNFKHKFIYGNFIYHMFPIKNAECMVSKNSL